MNPRKRLNTAFGADGVATQQQAASLLGVSREHLSIIASRDPTFPRVFSGLNKHIPRAQLKTWAQARNRRIK